MIILNQLLTSVIGNGRSELKMGKSFNKCKNDYSEKRNQYNEYKRKKNRVKEERYNEDYSEYRIHGYKKDTRQDS